MALNPITPQESEMAFLQCSQAVIAVANQAEQLTEWAEANLTEENLKNGTLLLGFDADGSPVAWTPEQLKAAQDMYANLAAISHWMRTPKGNSAKSPLQKLQAFFRAPSR